MEKKIKIEVYNLNLITEKLFRIMVLSYAIANSWLGTLNMFFLMEFLKHFYSKMTVAQILRNLPKIRNLVRVPVGIITAD